MEKNGLYGLLVYPTNNIGDEIQSIAAKRFLPRVDIYLDRENLNNVTSKYPIKIILNGWFLHNPQNWPPADIINPLIISFHITPSAASFLTSPKAIEYFKKHEPIGCRDLYTHKLLSSHGIETYFSGCLTLTLPKPKHIKKDTNKVILVDLPKKLEDNIKNVFDGLDIKTLTHYYRESYLKRYSQKIESTFPLVYKTIKNIKIFNRIYDVSSNIETKLLKDKDFNNKFKRAEMYLNEYASASLVITTRLHCALPCLAFDTPVILITKNKKDERFTGLSKFLNFYSFEEFESKILPNLRKMNIENPNKKELQQLKLNLINNVQEFIKE